MKNVMRQLSNNKAPIANNKHCQTSCTARNQILCIRHFVPLRPSHEDRNDTIEHRRPIRTSSFERIGKIVATGKRLSSCQWHTDGCESRGQRKGFALFSFSFDVAIQFFAEGHNAAKTRSEDSCNSKRSHNRPASCRRGINIATNAGKTPSNIHEDRQQRTQKDGDSGLDPIVVEDLCNGRHNVLENSCCQNDGCRLSNSR
mmetsp:Transcript_2546/g.4359  ORF Transcript_2546/g.4359 Transcript_2546/m.4359 type:complete len:201 (+) Transcript_2546:1965-2567(+)